MVESSQEYSSLPSHEEELAPTEFLGTRRLIAVGGGRGGVGKSLLAVNLAVYLAQLGKRVVLVDTDPTGANLHTHFARQAARQEPTLDRERTISVEASLVSTSVPGLQLLPAPHDALALPATLRAARRVRFLTELRTIAADYFVIDVGPGHASFSIDLMLAADVAVITTIPEPPAVETTYRFIRAAFRRKVQRALIKDRFHLTRLERVLATFGTVPPPIELIRALSRSDPHLGELAWAEAQSMRLSLVVNQTRVRTDVELGSWMSGLVARHYGIDLEELGHVEHDDTVWLTVRRNRPLLVDSPNCKAARNIERIARRLIAVSTSRLERPTVPRPLPDEIPNLYATLAITRSSSDEEIRRAYKRQREVYSTDGLATWSLLGEVSLAQAQARLDEAYDTLLDPIRRRAYDRSNFEDEPAELKPASETPPALAAEQLMLKNELARELGPDSEFSGTLLRKVRESQGIEIVEIANRTKIASMYLVAIENEQFELLPALVYVRGFLNEIAKFLSLDPAQVQKTYLRRMREMLAATSSRGGL